MNAEVRKNIAALPFNYSTYAVLIILEAARWWFGLPEPERAHYLALYPWLQHAAMPASLLLYVLAKVTPQTGIKPIIAEPEKEPSPPDTLPMGVLSPEETRTVLEAARLLQGRS